MAEECGSRLPPARPYLLNDLHYTWIIPVAGQCGPTIFRIIFRAMQVILKIVTWFYLSSCPWLIASFSKNLADWDNCDAAMLMLSHVIVTHEIGGYTESTFQVAVRRCKIESLAFTKFVLRNVGNSHFLSD